MFTSNFFYKFDLDISSNIAFSNDYSDIENLSKIIYKSYMNSLPYIILLDTSDDIDSSHFKSGLYIIYNKKITYIDWSLFFYYNHYFSNLVANKQIRFSLENCWYNVFFILTYYTCISGFRDSHKISLVSNSCNPAIFSIYDSYVYRVAASGKTIFSYYFSYPIGKFILSRCTKKILDNKYYLIGNLLDNLNYSSESNVINVLDTSNNIVDTFNCPKTFIRHNLQYGIFLKEQTPIICRDIPKDSLQYSYSDTVKQFSRSCAITNTLFFSVGRELSIEDVENLFKHVVKTIPKLNKYAKSFRIYLVENSILAITLDISLYYLLSNIIKVVDYVLSSGQNDITIDYRVDSKLDNSIHIVSELYLLVTVGLLYIPRVLYYTTIDNSDIRSHMHLVFSKEEIAILKTQQVSNEFSSLGDYIKVIIAKCLSIFMENHLIVYIGEQSIDYIPISKEMDNQYLKTLVEKNKKSKLVKGLLTKFIEKLVMSKSGYTLPIIMVNLFEIPLCESIQCTKVNIECRETRYPISISIYYNSEQMVMSISYNRSSQKIKYIFNEFIEELLR